MKELHQPEPPKEEVPLSQKIGDFWRNVVRMFRKEDRKPQKEGMSELEKDQFARELAEQLKLKLERFIGSDYALLPNMLQLDVPVVSHGKRMSWVEIAKYDNTLENYIEVRNNEHKPAQEKTYFPNNLDNMEMLVMQIPYMLRSKNRKTLKELRLLANQFPGASYPDVDSEEYKEKSIGMDDHILRDARRATGEYSTLFDEKDWQPLKYILYITINVEGTIFLFHYAERNNGNKKMAVSRLQSGTSGFVTLEDNKFFIDTLPTGNKLDSYKQEVTKWTKWTSIRKLTPGSASRAKQPSKEKNRELKQVFSTS